MSSRFAFCLALTVILAVAQYAEASHESQESGEKDNGKSEFAKSHPCTLQHARVEREVFRTRTQSSGTNLLLFTQPVLPTHGQFPVYANTERCA